MRSPWFLTTSLMFTYTTALVMPDVDHHHNAPRQPSSQDSSMSWVALGDSFISGTGAGNSYQGDTVCDRRTMAYPPQVVGSTSFDFASCVGTSASSSEIYNAELGSVITNESLALVTIGQNDVSYTPALSACLLFNSDCSNALSTFNNSLLIDTSFFYSFNEFINATLESLQWDSQNNILFQTAYPQLFESEPTACNNESFLVPGLTLTTDLRQEINLMTQQLNYVLSYWIDNLNYQWNQNPTGPFPIKFADQDERFSSKRFCQADISEPAFEDESIWFFHLGDRDEQQASALPQFVDSSAYSDIDAGTCFTTGTGNGNTDADLGANINCFIAQQIATNANSPFPSGQWPQINDGNGGNSSAKTFHPTSAGHAATAAELTQRIGYRLPGSGGKPSGKNLQIAAVGDSITWGYQSTSVSDNAGYRKYLHDILAADPTNTVVFHGSQLTGSAGTPWEKSEGYPGFTSLEIMEDMDITEIRKANVIALMSGTNDVGQATVFTDVVNAVSDLWNLVNKLNTANPDAVILWAHITQIGFDTSDWPPSTEQQWAIYWNAQINIMINRLRLDGVKVLKVHTTVTTFEHADGDTLHPSDNGYEKMAYDWAERLSDADDLGWLSSNSVAGQPQKCDGAPVWTANGQIANGAGLGPDLFSPIVCVDDSNDSTQCSCTAGSEAYSIPRVGDSCALNGYEQVYSVHFADLDGDGRAEYLWVDENGAVTAFYNNGPPQNPTSATTAQVSWIAAGIIASGAPGAQRQEVMFADINGDGMAEYIWVQASGEVQIYLNGGQISGSATPANVNWIYQGNIASGIGAPGSATAWADLSGDGRAEYLNIGAGGDVVAYWTSNFHEDGAASGQASVGFVNENTVASGVGGVRNGTIFADIQGLGMASYLNIQPGSGCPAVDLYRNNGGWFTTSSTEFVNWSGPQSIGITDCNNGHRVIFADLDGDGRAEYLEVDPDTSAVTAHWNGCDT